MIIDKIIIFISFTLFVSCITTGCSTKSWYEGGQISAKHNCDAAPLSEREQCLKNLNNKTYEEYQHKY